MRFLHTDLPKDRCKTNEAGNREIKLVWSDTGKGISIVKICKNFKQLQALKLLVNGLGIDSYQLFSDQLTVLGYLVTSHWSLLDIPTKTIKIADHC